MHPIVSQIVEAFSRRGNEMYGAEEVSQLQHALQCASLAVEDGADDTLVTAALLHDIGHILGEDALPEDFAENFDDKHEYLGWKFLEAHFGEAVTDPVRLHVLAKRYLCTVDADYEQALSPTSRKSYYDQGGKMSEPEKLAFEAEPQFQAAVKLRRWDDLGKDGGASTRPLDDMLHHIESAIAASDD